MKFENPIRVKTQTIYTYQRNDSACVLSRIYSLDFLCMIALTSPMVARWQPQEPPTSNCVNNND